jgi:hypothetical protein
LPLSLRKSAMVLKSGANWPVSQISSILRWHSPHQARCRPVSDISSPTADGRCLLSALKADAKFTALRLTSSSVSRG